MYRVIVAGCGEMSKKWIEVTKNRADCEIVALVDIYNDTANARKSEYDLDANVYTSLVKALDKENADLVLDITPPEAHYETVTTALKSGCHVFGEKPMSDSLENSEKMVECAIESKKEYFIMQNRRYLPGLCALKDFLGSKQLGNIGQISANFQLGPHFGGFRDEMDSPLIADMAIHTFDSARFITGKNAVSVYCHEFNPSWSWYRGNAGAVCIFEMEDGSVFDYRGCWCANGLTTSWESEWRVACANGAVYCDGEDKLYYEKITQDTENSILSEDFIKHGTITAITPSPMALQGHDACIGEMFESLQCGKKSQTDCTDNIHSIKMVYKAIESAKTGKTVLF